MLLVRAVSTCSQCENSARAVGHSDHAAVHRSGSLAGGASERISIVRRASMAAKRSLFKPPDGGSRLGWGGAFRNLRFPCRAGCMCTRVCYIDETESQCH